jgi:hypothetical protein
MSNYNRDSGFGRAILSNLHNIVPSFGRVFVVFDPDDTANPSYDIMMRLMDSDPMGVIRFQTTLDGAYDQIYSNNNDVILLDAYSQHTLTSVLAMSKNRFHIFGMDGVNGRVQGQRARIAIGGTGATNTSAIRMTGVGCSFRNLKISSSNTSTSALWAFEDGGEFFVAENCHFVREGVLTTTTAADILLNGDSSHYKNCMFGYTSQAITANGNRPCVDLGREQITGKVARDVIMDDCIFLRQSKDADNSFIYASGATDVERMFLLRNPIFWSDALSTTTMDECISGAASLTTGQILAMNPVAVKTPASISTTTGVFVMGYTPDATGAAAGIAIQAA